MRFDEAITRGLITDYWLLVISSDGKRDDIEPLHELPEEEEERTPLRLLAGPAVERRWSWPTLMA